MGSRNKSHNHHPHIHVRAHTHFLSPFFYSWLRFFTYVLCNHRASNSTICVPLTPPVPGSSWIVCANFTPHSTSSLTNVSTTLALLTQITKISNLAVPFLSSNQPPDCLWDLPVPNHSFMSVPSFPLPTQHPRELIQHCSLNINHYVQHGSLGWHPLLAFSLVLTIQKCEVY